LLLSDECEAKERGLQPCWERRRATGREYRLTLTEKTVSRAVSYIRPLSVDNPVGLHRGSLYDGA